MLYIWIFNKTKLLGINEKKKYRSKWETLRKMKTTIGINPRVNKKSRKNKLVMKIAIIVKARLNRRLRIVNKKTKNKIVVINY